MPGDPFQFLSPNTPIESGVGPFNLAWHNEVTRTLHSTRGQRDADNTAKNGAALPDGNPEIWIRNDSGGGLDQYSIVGIGARVVAPSKTDASHFGRAVFKSVSPTSGDPFAILQWPTADTVMCPSVLSGAAVCRVNMSSTTHEYADAGTGSYAALVSQSGVGPARILYADTTAATQLNGAINNSVTTITVDSTVDFPDTPFVILIGTEQLNVTATPSATTFTVTRGYNSTSAASHSDNDAVAFYSGEVWAVVNLDAQGGSASAWSTTVDGISTATGDQTGRGTKTLQNNNAGLVGRWKASWSASSAFFSYVHYLGLHTEASATAYSDVLAASIDIVNGSDTASFFGGQRATISATQAFIVGTVGRYCYFSASYASDAFAGILTTSYHGAAAWNSGTAYVAGDTVSLSGDLSEYVCILGHTNQTPPNATYWTIRGKKPRYAVQYGTLGSTLYGAWGTSGGGDTVSGGIITSLGSAITASSLGLGNVENTALSTWGGSTNIVTVGTITTGTWQATVIGDAYISSAATWNATSSATSGTNSGDQTAATTNYTPLTSADWSGSDPTNVANALDRISAAVAGLLAGPIP